MLYAYTCPECGWAGDRVARIADRDKQTCDQKVAATLPGQEDLGVCGAALVREEFSLTARMPDQWRRGTK